MRQLLFSVLSFFVFSAHGASECNIKIQCASGAVASCSQSDSSSAYPAVCGLSQDEEGKGQAYFCGRLKVSTESVLNPIYLCCNQSNAIQLSRQLMVSKVCDSPGKVVR